MKIISDMAQQYRAQVTDPTLEPIALGSIHGIRFDSIQFVRFTGWIHSWSQSHLTYIPGAADWKVASSLRSLLQLLLNFQKLYANFFMIT